MFVKSDEAEGEAEVKGGAEAEGRERGQKQWEYQKS